MPEFSVVCPIKDEIHLIPITLPSILSTDPSEVVLCLDKPAPKEVVRVIDRVVSENDARDVVRIIEIERNPEYAFHQAWVRRKGYLEAKYDRILRTDIDLLINRNVLKAVELVGKENIALASLSKTWYPRTFTDYWRNGLHAFLRLLHGLLDPLIPVTSFSGLYCIWRPYWLDSEPEEEVKRLVNPKQLYRGEKVDIKWASAITGEDTFLRDCVCRKYRCIYLRDVGAIDLGISPENSPFVQEMKGRYFARQGRQPLISIGRAIIRLQPYYLRGYIDERRRMARERVNA